MKKAFILLFMIVLSACTQSGAKANAKKKAGQEEVKVINEKISLRLVQPCFVFKEQNTNSPVIDIYAKGRTVEVYSSTNDWLYLFQERAYINKTLLSNQASLPLHQYDKYVFSIPKKGSSDFKVMKIAGKYTVNLKNANTKKVLERIAVLEKKEFNIASELAPITFEGSLMSYSSLLNEIKLLVNYEFNDYNQTFLPLLWPAGLSPNLSATSIELNLGQMPDQKQYLYNEMDYTSQIFYDYKNFLLITEDQVILLDKTRGIKKQSELSSLDEISKHSYSPLCTVSHFNSPVIVSVLPYTIDSESGVDVVFLDKYFKLIRSHRFAYKTLTRINFSAEGDRILLLLKDNESDSITVTDYIVFDRYGRIQDKKEFSMQKTVFYNKSFSKRISYDHNQILIWDLESKLENVLTAPWDMRNTWLKTSSEKLGVVAMNNQLLSFDLDKASINTLFNLSDSYHFVSISENFVFLSSRSSSGTWSVIDLNSGRICLTMYKGDLFSSQPSRIISFPANDRFFMLDEGKPTRYLVFSDINGVISKVQIFEETRNMRSINFISTDILKIVTDDAKIYYLSIGDIISKAKKI